MNVQASSNRRSDFGSRSGCVGPEVQLRSFPYPYRSMLAICSDLDSTPDRHVYGETMRFLNTTETTSMGPGVGLEVGNSIHFRAIPPQFSYWDTDDAGREMVHALIHSGHIDCLHSFGERVSTRADAARALDELTRQNCRLEVWVDHGGAATNFGSDIMEGHGDEAGHPSYHADLTIGYGIRYVWRGRTTSIVGQDIPATLRGILQWRHPVASGRTLLKEGAKQSLARCGNTKYAMHGVNAVLRRITLRDGHPVHEFMRCNPHWRGTSSCDEGRTIGEVLTRAMLDRLSRRGGTCILYTHLGKIDNPEVPLNPGAVAAFRRLADAYRSGMTLVTTTRRLLGYCRAIRETICTTWREGRTLHIDLDTEAGTRLPGSAWATDLLGLTFYVPAPEATCVTLAGQEVADLQCNPPDHTGRSSVSLAWPLLEFPKI